VAVTKSRQRRQPIQFLQAAASPGRSVEDATRDMVAGVAAGKVAASSI
jgi:hypothetical protein